VLLTYHGSRFTAAAHGFLATAWLSVKIIDSIVNKGYVNQGESKYQGTPSSLNPGQLTAHCSKLKPALHARPLQASAGSLDIPTHRQTYCATRWTLCVIVCSWWEDDDEVVTVTARVRHSDPASQLPTDELQVRKIPSISLIAHVTLPHLTLSYPRRGCYPQTTSNAHTTRPLRVLIKPKAENVSQKLQSLWGNVNPITCVVAVYIYCIN